MLERGREAHFGLREALERAKGLLGGQYNERELFGAMSRRSREQGDVDSLLNDLDEGLKEKTNDVREQERIKTEWLQKLNGNT